MVSNPISQPKFCLNPIFQPKSCYRSHSQYPNLMTRHFPVEKKKGGGGGGFPVPISYPLSTFFSSLSILLIAACFIFLPTVTQTEESKHRRKAEHEELLKVSRLAGLIITLLSILPFSLPVLKNQT